MAGMEKMNNAIEKLTTIDFMAFFSASSLGTSLILIAAIAILRRFLIKYVRKDDEIMSKDQRRWVIRIKNASVGVMLVGLILIWAPQLHTFALSITAFAVALVVATKEMILCLTGAFMRATSSSFKVGEWITIDGVTGEVVDLDAFSFRLQEVDMAGKTYQFTGRTITIPNSKLFTNNVENANFFKAYIFEDVRVGVQFTDIDPAVALSIFKDVSVKYYEPYAKDAAAFNKKIRKRAGIDVGSPDPVFDLTTSELGHYQFHGRFFLPTNLASNVGVDITQEFLSKIHHLRIKSKEHEAEEEEEAKEPKEVPESVI
jgi:small-conductance mechanosensitive channel